VTRLLLLRHAQSEWNALGRWQGMADPPLSPRGREQAATAGRLLVPWGISGAVSSDLQRARATAEAIAAELALVAPIGIEPGLREYDLGAWSGLTRVEIEAGWPGEIEEWRHGRLVATPGGETRTAFVARISATVARIVADPPAETVVVVTHGGVISALGLALGEPPRRFTHLSGFWTAGG
jgi:broad specificity phosphatase PhoE